MTHPDFPSEIPLPTGSGDPYLLRTLAQWKYCCHNLERYGRVAAALENELDRPEMVRRVLEARFDADDRLRLAALTRIVTRDLPDAEKICLEFLSHANEWDREQAAELAIQFGSDAVTEALVRLVESDPDPYVRAAACSSLVGRGEGRVLPVLIRAAETPCELDPEDQRPGPQDRAISALDQILATGLTQTALPGGYATFSGRYEPEALLAFAKSRIPHEA